MSAKNLNFLPKENPGVRVKKMLSKFLISGKKWNTFKKNCQKNLNIKISLNDREKIILDSNSTLNFL